MMVSFTEKRACSRFRIPGALISYKKIRLFGKRTDWIERSCHLYDLSRGGVRFLAGESLAIGTKVFLELTCPNEREPLRLSGIARWISENKGGPFRFQVGVQLNPYGNRKKHNPVKSLNTIISLEKLHLKP